MVLLCFFFAGKCISSSHRALMLYPGCNVEQCCRCCCAFFFLKCISFSHRAVILYGGCNVKWCCVLFFLWLADLYSSYVYPRDPSLCWHQHWIKLHHIEVDSAVSPSVTDAVFPRFFPL